VAPFPVSACLFFLPCRTRLHVGELSLEKCSFEPYRQGLCVVCQTFQKAAFPVHDAKP
jgi:hypothetical protein